MILNCWPSSLLYFIKLQIKTFFYWNKYVEYWYLSPFLETIRSKKNTATLHEKQYTCKCHHVGEWSIRTGLSLHLQDLFLDRNSMHSLVRLFIQFFKISLPYISIHNWHFSDYVSKIWFTFKIVNCDIIQKFFRGKSWLFRPGLRLLLVFVHFYESVDRDLYESVYPFWSLRCKLWIFGTQPKKKMKNFYSLLPFSL